ncbi:hypothetical protein [Anaeropeptidivorans aminofermentans]|uniref:hypothetical protein n=1 Tax=Anaeropeptidivorans aminofermentans TaxID=2934315 RepID=UPI0020258579|nr:hypothetical protein [Anaeropeptidivorans aminofermentans]
MFIRKKMLKKAISLIMTASILLNYNIYSVFAEKGNNFKASKAANHTVHNENCVENHSEEVVDKDFVVYDLLMKTGILANSSREASQHSKENSNDKSEIDDNIKENATKIVDSGAYDKTEMTDTIDKIDSNENIENASDKEAADIEKEIDKNITLDINGNKNSENSATFKDALDETTDDKDSFFIGYKITQGTQDSLLSDSIAEAELMYLATYMNKEYDDIEQSEVIYDVEDNPTYLAISFISGGYAIMIRSNLIVTEYSYNDKSPYSDSIGGKNYYLGVLNYYNGENITDMQNIMSGDRLSDDSIETFQKLNDEYNQVSPPVLLEEIYMDKELKEAVIHNSDNIDQTLSATLDIEARDEEAEQYPYSTETAKENNIDQQQNEAIEYPQSVTIVSAADIAYPDTIRNSIFGDNEGTSCGVIASEILLRYYNDHYADGLVETKYYSGPFNDFHALLKSEYWLTKFLDGSMPYNNAELVNYYIGNDSNRRNLGYHSKYKIIVGVESEAKSRIDEGYPVILYTVMDNAYGNHAMVAYGYEERFSSESEFTNTYFRLHEGWLTGSKDKFVNTTFFYGGITWLEKFDSHSHDFSKYTIFPRVDETENYHAATCTECELFTKKAHQYEHFESFPGDPQSHGYRCSLCNQTKSICNNPDIYYTDNGNNHTVKCNNCLFVMTEGHEYGDWIKTPSEHKTVCKKCSHSESSPHKNLVWVRQNDLQHSVQCSICGYLTLSNHNYSSWMNLGTQHSKVCSTCNDTVNEKHRLVFSGRTSAGHTLSCTKCGYSSTSGHKFSPWSSNSSFSLGSTSLSFDTTLNQDLEVFKDEALLLLDGEDIATNKTYLCNESECDDEHYITDDYTLNNIQALSATEGHSRRCLDCDYEENGNHAYSSWSYSSFEHSRTCNICGHKQSGKHSYGSWTSNSSLQHRRSCSCGYTETASHSLGNWSSEGSSQHIRSCSSCDYTEKQSHNVPYAWSSDSSKHYKKCSTCGYSESGNHSYGSWSGTQANHTQKCYTCGYIDTKSHSFGTYSSDYSGSTHSRTCYTCNYKDSQSHNFGSWSSWQSNRHERSCRTCSYTDTKPHNFGSYSSNSWSSQHERTCRTCYYAERENHSYSTGSWQSVSKPNHCRSRQQTCSKCGHSQWEYDYTHWMLGNSCMDCRYRK